MKPTDQIIIENLMKEIKTLREVMTQLANSGACLYSETDPLRIPGMLYPTRNMLKADLDKANDILRKEVLPVYKNESDPSLTSPEPVTATGRGDTMQTIVDSQNIVTKALQELTADERHRKEWHSQPPPKD